jgi:hypothetical protein
MRYILAVVSVLCLQPIYFFAMSHLDLIISHERTWEHIRDAFNGGVLETGYHSKNQFIDGGDRFTDCYSLGEGLQPGVSSVVAGITAARPASDQHACDDLKQAAINPAGAPWDRYARYWHGYRVYSSPLASLFPILVLKIINLFVLAGVSALFVLQASKLIGNLPTICLIAPVLFCSDYVRIWQVTPHTVSTAVIVGGSAIFALALRRQYSPASLVFLAALFGSIFNFVDFLVNPPWMPMLLAFFVMAAGRFQATRTALLCVAVWFAAYSCTWASKWIFAYIVDPSFDIRSDVLNTAMFRIAGDNSKVLHIPFAATAKVFGNSLASWGTPLLVALLFFFWKNIQIVKFDKRTFAHCCWPTLIPIAWFEILSNHSQIHSFFVSRSAAAAMGIALSSALIAASIEARPTVRLLRSFEVLLTR